MAANYATVPRKQPQQFGGLRNLYKGSEAAILGSGPSLDANLPFLKDFKGIVFAGNSTINPCMIKGRTPDWTMVLDADPYVPNQFRGLPDLDKIKIILPTYCEPTLPSLFDPDLTWWCNVYSDHWLLKHGAHYIYPEVDGLVSPGCVPGAMIRMAYYMGIRKVYLLGLDFGYPGGRERCTTYRNLDGEWVDVGHDPFCDDKSPREEVNGVLTTVKLKVSHVSIVAVIKHLPGMEAIDCSAGIMTEFKKMDFREAVDGKH